MPVQSTTEASGTKTGAANKINDADVTTAKALVAKQAMVFIEGKYLKEASPVRPESTVKLDGGSFDGSSNEDLLVKTSSGLLLQRSNVNSDPAGSSSAEGGADAFSDSRNWLLMTPAAFQFALTNGSKQPVDAKKVAFIKSSSGNVTQKNVKPNIDGVVFNGSELYFVDRSSGDEKWTQVLLSNGQ